MVGTSGFRVFRVPGFNTRITRNNFGYRDLLPEVVIGFFGLGLGFGFRVSDNMPTHICDCKILANYHYSNQKFAANKK